MQATPPTEALASLARRIDAVLPQTQCMRCGYPDCAAYAHAVASGAAEINCCPPGGAAGIERLAAVTGRPPRPLDAQCGAEGPRHSAVILEASCIGCTLCIAACPTDAIVGAPKWLHAVLESRCTGCALCVPACPVDCIALENASGLRTGWAAWSEPQADAARAHYEARARRLAKKRRAQSDALLPTGPSNAAAAAASTTAADDKKRDVVQAALARAREQRRAPPPSSSA